MIVMKSSMYRRNHMTVKVTICQVTSDDIQQRVPDLALHQVLVTYHQFIASLGLPKAAHEALEICK